MGKLKCQKIWGSRLVGKYGGQVLAWSRSPCPGRSVGRMEGSNVSKMFNSGSDTR